MGAHPKPEERRLARRLRRDDGMPMKRIAARLGVSLSTVSLWVRDIELDPVHRERNRRQEYAKRATTWSDLNRAKRTAWGTVFPSPRSRTTGSRPCGYLGPVFGVIRSTHYPRRAAGGRGTSSRTECARSQCTTLASSSTSMERFRNTPDSTSRAGSMGRR